MMKVIEDKINLIIDVSFPGYPIGRIDILYPTIKNNEISHEDQFIISLCHLFKHAELAIKDINDIYMILNSGRLNFVILKEKLTENSLLFFFSLVLNFIYLNYQLSNEIKEKISKSIKIDFSICENFPEWLIIENLSMNLKSMI
ncbi:nucleotidyltransferase family protein [Bacillus sp. OR9]|nr:nucleotidyltransferase family protein [Bacillus sp. OR9]